MDINWNEYKSVPTTQNPNKKNIPVNLLKPTEENMDKFNDLLNYCIVNKFRELKMTTSGGIKIEPLMIYPAYYYSQCNLGAELIICKEKTYRFQFRADIAQDEKNKGYSGTKAFMNFKELCNKYGIDLKKYEIENGKLIHDSISNPPIELGKNALRDVIYEHVNHIDFHSSYPAGLANTHPEFYSLINDLFETRRKRNLIKQL